MDRIFRIAFDIDNTITACPEFFSMLSKAIIGAGHEVYILTGTMLEDEPQRIKFVESFDVKYTKFISTDGESKRKYALEYNIDMAIDDIPNAYGIGCSNVPFKFININELKE